MRESFINKSSHRMRTSISEKQMEDTYEVIDEFMNVDLICQDCFNITKIDNITVRSSMSINVKTSESEAGSPLFTFQNSNIRMKTWCACSHGSFVNAFICDSEISDIIRQLNLKGYYTDFCCAGHAYEQKPYSGNVIFRHCYNFINAPVGWEISYDYRSELTILEEYQNKDKHIIVLENLRSWVNELLNFNEFDGDVINIIKIK